MIRIFVFLLIVLGLGIGFAWIADRPGVVTLAWQGREIETSLMVVAVALVAIITAILFVWAIIRGVISSPRLLARFFETRRRDRGYAALSKGLIAAGTGDTATARQLTKESNRLLKNEPLVALLDAQTAMLEGKRDAARARFQSMLEDENTELLGLRGLYLEAEREGEREASRQYAEKAADLAPALGWAGAAKLKNQMMDGDWEVALKTLEQNRSAGLVDKPTAKRHRAVLLTALAMAEEPKDPDRAAKLASEAHRLAPEFVPAAIIGATAYSRVNNLRKASKLVEAVWKKSPHPQLADSYVHLRMGDSALDRMKRAQVLAKMRPNHPESNIAIAEAAIDATEWAKARDAMKPVLANNLTERACLIMADIEEGENGDRGRMRDWLSRAVRAPRNARWTSGGYTSENWLPISPVTGEIDAFEWKVPVEQLGGPGEPIDLGDLPDPLKPEPSIKEPKIETASTTTAASIVAVEEANEETSDVEGEESKKPTNPSTPLNSNDNAAQGDDVNKDGDEQDAVIELTAVEEASSQTQSDEAKSEPDSEDTIKKAEFPLQHRPDDPGVDPDAKPENKNFRIF